MTRRVAHLAHLPSEHPGRGIRMAQLAEWMAENGGTVTDASKALGWPFESTKQAWLRIRKAMGPQAR